MKYKVEKTHATGVALSAIRQRITECNDAARAFAKANGWSLAVTSTLNVGGGISGIGFDEKPAKYKEVHAVGKSKFYYPYASNKPLCKELDALPVVSVFDYNKVIDWDGFLSRYGLTCGGDYWLLDIPGNKLPKATGLVEITSVEYGQLKTPLPA
ncbi:hypothetical protein [Hymenobacter lapidiphilus]|uniref:Uncharacterized protein n=1 Tax=Hymenobacter lapidiphilus TaxID=2608003 RepID=A0A7Y7U757_9BACT|nr:hypothetical protein [Hymenobacter lapidiphilus]NVO33511.1 hypothetical protein [Hymenobacter lapidiphilus]